MNRRLSVAVIVTAVLGLSVFYTVFIAVKTLVEILMGKDHDDVLW